MGFVVTIGLDTLNFTLALLLVTLGLVVIYGLMNVINMAHGEFFLLGAYCVVLMQNARLSFWWALLFAPVVLALVGLAVEELIIRHVYRRFIDLILGTWGISLALKQVVIIVFGPTAQSIVSPIPGPVQILGVTYPAYRVFIMGFTVLLAGATFLFFYRTYVGLAIRGVIANRAMAASLGINTRLLDRSTFAIGAALAGLAGAVMAPIMSVDPTRARSDENQQGRLAPAFGDAPKELKCSRISPMYVFKGKHRRLSSRTGHYPVRECCELSAPQDDRLKRGHALLRYRDVQQRRQEGDVFGRFELDLRERGFQFREAYLG